MGQVDALCFVPVAMLRRGLVGGWVGCGVKRIFFGGRLDHRLMPRDVEARLKAFRQRMLEHSAAERILTTCKDDEMLDDEGGDLSHFSCHHALAVSATDSGPAESSAHSTQIILPLTDADHNWCGEHGGGCTCSARRIVIGSTALVIVTALGFATIILSTPAPPSPPPRSPPPSSPPPVYLPASPSPSHPPPSTPPPFLPPCTPPLGPPPSPPPPTLDRINARYALAPFADWPPDGTLPNVGVLVHCFDYHELEHAKFVPKRMHPWDSPSHPTLISASLIFASQLQVRSLAVAEDALFGCGMGGIILRPGVARVVCGNPSDCGGYCHQLCPPRPADRTGQRVNTPVDALLLPGEDACDTRPNGAASTETPGLSSCVGGCSWAPADIGAYLHRNLAERVRGGLLRDGTDPNNNGYNEFLVDAFAWNASLPTSVEAFLSGVHGETTRAIFLRRYPQMATTDVPLVELTEDPTAPFVLAPRQGATVEDTR